MVAYSLFNNFYFCSFINDVPYNVVSIIVLSCLDIADIGWSLAIGANACKRCGF